MTIPKQRAKRVMDLLIAGAATVVCAPVMGAVALAVRTRLGSPVLFRQERPGLYGETFEILKFRTMLEPDPGLNLVTNEQRMTPLGSFLRSTSLDELPSLINVIRGELSLVGPRPLRVAYLDRYSDEQRERHSVRPGLTGLAQTSGRNSLSWDDRLQLDVDYVRNWSIGKDLGLLFRTVAKVFKREGIRAEGQATMSAFFGPERTADLAIRPLGSEDLATRVDWLRDPSIRQGISIDFWPDLESMKEWFDKASQDSKRVDYVTYDRRTGSTEGMVGLVSSAEDSGELYIYINPQSQGRGYGRQSMQLLMTKAREIGLSEIHLETKVGNERSLRLYQRLGFRLSDDQPAESKIAMTRNLI